MEIQKAEGKLGVLVVGIGGAVSSTFVVGTLAARKGLTTPIGSLTQMAYIELGKGADKRESKIKDVVPLADLNDLVIGGWDIFEEDVYAVAERLKQQQDLIFIRERDYIKNPKDSGYTSYHVIYGVPVYHVDGMEYFPVEIQIRTMSMDFWASMEHRICYKNEQTKKEELQKSLVRFSQELKDMERSMHDHLNGTIEEENS